MSISYRLDRNAIDEVLVRLKRKNVAISYSSHRVQPHANTSRILLPPLALYSITGPVQGQTLPCILCTQTPRFDRVFRHLARFGRNYIQRDFACTCSLQSLLALKGLM